MRGQSELLLQVLREEAVDPTDGHQVEDRARCAPHQDVVRQLPFDRREEICESGQMFVKTWTVIISL